MSPDLDNFVSGMISLASALAGLFFLRFWRDTRDRLFLLFAFSFGLMAFQRFLLQVTTRTIEELTPLYGLRFVAYLLIVLAILDKNRARPRP